MCKTSSNQLWWSTNLFRVVFSKGFHFNKHLLIIFFFDYHTMILTNEPVLYTVTVLQLHVTYKYSSRIKFYRINFYTRIMWVIWFYICNYLFQIITYNLYLIYIIISFAFPFNYLFESLRFSYRQAIVVFNNRPLKFVYINNLIYDLYNLENYR